MRYSGRLVPKRSLKRLNPVQDGGHSWIRGPQFGWKVVLDSHDPDADISQKL